MWLVGQEIRLNARRPETYAGNLLWKSILKILANNIKIILSTQFAVGNRLIMITQYNIFIWIIVELLSRFFATLCGAKSKTETWLILKLDIIHKLQKISIWKVYENNVMALFKNIDIQP